MEAFALSLVTLFSATLGGMLAQWLRGKLARLMALGAGVAIGVALLDLLPEALDQAAMVHITSQSVLLAAACGFFVFQVLARVSLLGTPQDYGLAYAREPSRLTSRTAIVAAAGRLIHSLLDGIAIGIAFQTSAAIGVAVAIAVIGHDALDGLRTATVVVAQGNTKRRSAVWLAIDALTPVVGAALAFTIAVPTGVLVIILGGFAGCFVYLGAAELLPKAQRRDHTPWPIVLFAAGVALPAIVTRILGGL